MKSILIASLMLAGSATAAQLAVAAKSDGMIWNAVAVDGKRVFVAGPRWTGSKGPALGLIDKAGKPQAYPDAGWNGWKQGGDNAVAFVNVNAIHLDGKGNLWAIDSGSPDFGGDPLPHGAKAVQIDLRTNRVKHVYEFGPDVALQGSYVDDIRFNGDHAYLTDAGKPGIIVLDLKSGKSRRVLDGAAAATAPQDRVIDVAGTVVRGGDGAPLRVNADPFEVSPDGKQLYFGPLTGPWSQIETRLLDDPTVDAATIAQAVRPWADLPPVGGTVMDREGNLYFTDLKTSSLKKRAPDGVVTTVIQDDRLHWVDAPMIDAFNRIWLPVPQMDRGALFNQGVSKVQWPVMLYTLQLEPEQQ